MVFTIVVSQIAIYLTGQKWSISSPVLSPKHCFIINYFIIYATVAVIYKLLFILKSIEFVL